MIYTIHHGLVDIPLSSGAPTVPQNI